MTYRHRVRSRVIGTLEPIPYPPGLFLVGLRLKVMVRLICLRLHSPIADDDEDNWSCCRTELLPLPALLKVLVLI
jgi:hypothetical protein